MAPPGRGPARATAGVHRRRYPGGSLRLLSGEETVAELMQRCVELLGDVVTHDYGESDKPGDTGDIEAEFQDPDGNRFLLHT
jgi:hypothetical protein